MKKTLVLISITVALFLQACDDGKTSAQKVADQTANVYSLNDAERGLASINAKQYWEKEWLPAGNKRGQVINCRPTDSNFNGMVSCTGYMPKPPDGGQFVETKMFCGYTPNIVGCSDQDTVK